MPYWSLWLREYCVPFRAKPAPPITPAAAYAWGSSLSYEQSALASDAKESKLTFPYPPPPYAVEVRRGSQFAPRSSSSKNGSADAAAAAAAASETSRSNLRALLLLIQVVMRRKTRTRPMIPATARRRYCGQ